MEFNRETGVAFVRLIIGLAGGVFATLGWAFDADFWFNIGLSILAVVIFVYTWWWKNNNLTKASQEAQLVLDQIKISDKLEGDDLDEDEMCDEDYVSEDATVGATD